jgi:LytS/YehU family sensor histidine kinase
MAFHMLLVCAGVTVLDQVAVMAMLPDEILSNQSIALGQLIQSFLPIRMVAYLIWCGGYLTLRQWILRRENEFRISRAELMAAKAELEMLRAQVDPHFIFNALNSVLAVADQPDRVSRMIHSLCRHLRFSCESSRSNHTLRDELKAVENYIEIEQFRFEEGLIFEMQVEPACLSLRVPAGCLLIPVENAVKHGGATSPRPLRIGLNARHDATHLTLTICNTGRWRDTMPDHNAVGMKNLTDILSRLFGDQSSVSISESNGHVVVNIIMPAARR